MKYDQQHQPTQRDACFLRIQAQTIDGILYFSINRGSNDKQCWKTDGTTLGTTCLASSQTTKEYSPRNTEIKIRKYT